MDKKDEDIKPSKEENVFDNNEEVKDLGLSELEAFVKSEVKGKEKLNIEEDDDININWLENQIDHIDDSIVIQNDSQTNFLQVPDPTKAKNQTLADIEQKYHNKSFFFGDLIDIELQKLIPSFKKKYHKDPNNDDLIQYLNLKEKQLYEMKEYLANQVQTGKLSEHDYVKQLKETLQKNKDIEIEAVTNQTHSLSIKRIRIRIQKLSYELDAIYSEIGVSSTFSMIQEKKQNSTVKIPLQSQNTYEYMRQGTEIMFDYVKNEQSNESMSIAYLTKKIEIYKSFLDYLITNLTKERPQEIKVIKFRLKKAEIELSQMKKSGKEKELNQLDKEFPNLTSDFIIGTSRQERNIKIQEIFNEVKQDISEVKQNTPKLLPTYNKYYITIMKKLKQIKESKFGILPILEKKPFVIPFKKTNDYIKPGALEFKIINITGIKAKRYFYVQYEFVYKQNKISDKTSFNSETGEFNYAKTFQLDKRKIRSSFLRSKIFFTLYKKKFFVKDKKINSLVFPLSKFVSFNSIKNELNFMYKKGKNVNVNIEFSINCALGKPQLEIQLFTIKKLFPIYNIPKQQRKVTEEFDYFTPRPQSLMGQKRQQRTPKQGKSNQISSQITKKDKSKTNLTISNVEGSKFRFPIMDKKEKKILINAIEQKNYPEFHLNFQEKIFSLTFLEEFSKELESQMMKFSMKGDSNGSKEARRLFKHSNSYLSSLSQKIQSGTMTTEQYKNLIEKFITIDNDNLKAFIKLNLSKPSNFVKNRLFVLKEELSKLKSLLEG